MDLRQPRRLRHDHGALLRSARDRAARQCSAFCSSRISRSSPRHGIAPKTTTKIEKELGYYGALEKNGAESFYPRQILRELFVLNLGFGLLVTFACFFPLDLGEPQAMTTPEHVKPEWYFLPVYQFLKYFDDTLYTAMPFLAEWNDKYQISSQVPWRFVWSTSLRSDSFCCRFSTVVVIER